MPLTPQTIKGCKNEEKDAIKALYQESSGWMLAVALRYINDRNEAMSIVNISILTIIKKIKVFDENKTGSPEAWMKTILIRKAIDYLRKEKGRNGDIESISASSDLIVSFNEENTRVENLRQIINMLPKRSRMVFNLYAIEGYRHSEIAGLLQISDGTSKWHLSEARKTLQELLLKMDQFKVKSS